MSMGAPLEGAKQAAHRQAGAAATPPPPRRTAGPPAAEDGPAPQALPAADPLQTFSWLQRPPDHVQQHTPQERYVTLSRSQQAAGAPTPAHDSGGLRGHDTAARSHDSSAARRASAAAAAAAAVTGARHHAGSAAFNDDLRSSKHGGSPERDTNSAVAAGRHHGGAGDVFSDDDLDSREHGRSAARNTNGTAAAPAGSGGSRHGRPDVGSRTQGGDMSLYSAGGHGQRQAAPDRTQPAAPVAQAAPVRHAAPPSATAADFKRFAAGRGGSSAVDMCAMRQPGQRVLHTQMPCSFDERVWLLVERTGPAPPPGGPHSLQLPSLEFLTPHDARAFGGLLGRVVQARQEYGLNKLVDFLHTAMTSPDYVAAASRGQLEAVGAFVWAFCMQPRAPEQPLSLLGLEMGGNLRATLTSLGVAACTPADCTAAASDPASDPLLKPTLEKLHQLALAAACYDMRLPVQAFTCAADVLARLRYCTHSGDAAIGPLAKAAQRDVHTMGHRLLVCELEHGVAWVEALALRHQAAAPVEAGARHAAAVERLQGRLNRLQDSLRVVLSAEHGSLCFVQHPWWPADQRARELQRQQHKQQQQAAADEQASAGGAQGSAPSPAPAPASPAAAAAASAAAGNAVLHGALAQASHTAPVQRWPGLVQEVDVDELADWWRADGTTACHAHGGSSGGDAGPTATELMLRTGTVKRGWF